MNKNYSCHVNGASYILEPLLSTSTMPQAEISTRHFPDVSDTSFQIPSFADSTNALLRENQLGGLELDAAIDHSFIDDEFGSGMDIDPFSTPVPRSRKQKCSPLRLSEITPLRERSYATMAEPERHEQEEENGTSYSREGSGVAEKGRQEDGNSSVRHIPPKKESVDDMFERRKRDNYQQMGIDLSFKSTARLRRDSEEMERPDIPSSKSNVESNVAVKRQRTEHQVKGAPKIIAGKPKSKRVSPSHPSSLPFSQNLRLKPVIGQDAGIAKHKSRVATSTTQPKSILKPSKPPASTLPPSTLTRILTTASHTPQAERPRWGDVVAEAQETSQRRESIGNGIAAIGGGLIDVLVMYGEKLKGSFGYVPYCCTRYCQILMGCCVRFSSASKESTPQAKDVSANSHRSQLPTDVPRDDNPINHPTQAIAGPSRSPRLSELSPFRSNRHKGDVLTLSDLSPSKPKTPVDEESEMGREQPTDMPPKPQSKKRTLTETSTQESKKRKFTPDAPMARVASSRPISKREKVTRTEPAAKETSKPQPLGSSRAVNKAATQPRHKSQPVNNGHRLGTATSAPNLKGKSAGKSSGATHSSRGGARKEQHSLGSFTLPSGPVFASDVYRERALEKTQKEREERDGREKEKRNFKAGVMPYFSKPVNQSSFFFFLPS